MAAYQTLEDLLFAQTRKLQDLEIATDLIQSKNIVQEELTVAYKEVCSVAQGIQDLKEDVQKMKMNNERCKELMAMLKSLDNQIQHMEKNIPPNIQEYVKSDLKSSNNVQDAAEYANDSINNSTVCHGNTANNEHTLSNIKSCKKILFNEPEMPYIQDVTEQEFSKIPKYIIARYTLETLNNLISNINQIIKSKYSIIALGKNGAKKKGELDLYLQYNKEQMSLGLGEENTYFFTAKDYERYIKSKIDKTKLNLLTVLRHCKRLREIRTAKTVHYALILSNFQ